MNSIVCLVLVSTCITSILSVSAQDRPTPPGKPHLAADNEITADLVTIRWTKPTRDGGSPITGYLVEHRRTGSPHWVRATPLLVPFPELTISGLEPGWRYQFRVSAENAVGLSDPSEISEPLTVTLQKFAITAPKFTDELKDVVALENEKSEFIVHFLGQPPPKICWFKDGFEIFSSRRTRILTETDKSILTIHQTALADEGEIKCTATNKAGHASTKARLNLEAPPTIRLPRQYEEGLLFEIGEVIRLKVSVAGRPTPLVFWTHNGESIQNNDRYEIEYVDRSSVLKISEAIRSDRGEYQIKAVNKIGQDLASFLVTVTDKPSPPGRARVVMTLGRSVTLSWNTPHDDGGCKIGNYIVEYYRLGWNVWLKAATSRQLTTILGDLIEGSEYKFRVKAESPYGVSEPSEESEVIFIPDAKRGITTPQERSRSQPKDIINQIAIPIAAKRKSKPRSRSSTNEDGIPVRPERTKIKSPPKTPERSPEPTRKEVNTLLHQALLDRASIARELSYGSPEIRMKKTVLDLPAAGSATSSERSSPIPKTPSPRAVSPQRRESLPVTPTGRRASSPGLPPSRIESKSPSPRIEKSPARTAPSLQRRSPSPSTDQGPKERKVLSRDNSENYGGSSEFMLVLYPDGTEKGERRPSDFMSFDFDENSIPPPLSLSAPELGVEPPPFENLRASCSSTELLHERAMIRFNLAAAAEEAERHKQDNVSIPKIQINSKDDQDIVGLERKHSLRRRSSGGVVQQQVLWAQRRLSLRSSDLFESKLQSKNTATADDKRELMMQRQRSESEEMEEQEFEKVRAKMALQSQSSFEKRSIEVVDEDKWMEDYEESIPSEEEEEEEDEDESDFSTDDRKYDEEPPPRNIYSDEDEDVYHPGMMMGNGRKSISNEPFEILTKKNKLPDPNFIPKPILKKSEDPPPPLPPRVEEPPPNVKTRSHSPMPQFRRASKDTPSFPTTVKELEGNKRGRSFSLAQPSKATPLIKTNTFPSDARQRSFSLIPQEDVLSKSPLKELPEPSEVTVKPGYSISAVAQLTGITAASIVIPQGLLAKKKDEEEAKVVIDHYGDIVRSVSQRKPSVSHMDVLRKYSVEEIDYVPPVMHEKMKITEKHKAEQLKVGEPLVMAQKASTSPMKEIMVIKLELADEIAKKEAEKKALQKERKSSVSEQRKSSISEQRKSSISEPQRKPSIPEQQRKSSMSEQRKSSISEQRKSSISEQRKSSISDQGKPERRLSNARRQEARRSPTPKRSPTPQRGRASSRNLRRTAKRSQTPSKSPNRLENWSDRPRKSSPSPVPQRRQLRQKSPSPLPMARPRPMLREIMTQTSVGLEMEPHRSSSLLSLRNEELIAKAESNVKSYVDYITDLAMFAVACWFYLFSNELLAIPVLLIMVYRQLKSEVRRRIPKWIARRLSKKKKQ